MASLAHHLFMLAHQNQWANHRLLRACAALDDAAFAAPRTSFFPSLKATANHILTVDWYYVDALESALRGTPVRPDALRAFFDPEEPFATCAEIRREQRAVDARLIAVCATLRDADLDRHVGVMRRSGVQYETFERLLAHLFEHQIHHRGQIHAMLAGTGVAPPQLDEFFCANDAGLRARELAELGTSEEEIFGALAASG
ncbi:MAG: DinB family protein [Sandaracinus sp.]